MTVARWQATIVNEKGDIVSGAQIEVRREIAGSPLATLFSDRDGLVPLGNPFTVGTDGFAAFHSVGGAYRITATASGFTRTWRYVPIGLQGESDAVLLDISYRFDPSTSDADPGVGEFRFNNATLASVTKIFLSETDDFGATVSAWIARMDDYGSSSDRGVIFIRTLDGTAEFIGQVTGTIADDGAYRDVTVTHLASTGTFAEGARVGINFTPKGVDGQVPSSRTITAGTGLTGGGDLSADRSLAIDKASDANIRAAASDKVLTSDRIESASAGVALSDAATVAVDWDTGINFTLTVTANRAIGNPTNGQPGTWRTILVQGDSGTDRTITFGNQYLGEVPTITDCDSGRWYLLMIYCVSSTHFVVSSKKANG